MPVIAPPTVPENTVSIPRFRPRFTPDSTSCGGAIGHQMADAHHRAIAWRARDAEAALTLRLTRSA